MYKWKPFLFVSIENNPYCKVGKTHDVVVKGVDNCRRNDCISKDRWDPVERSKDLGKERRPM